MELPARPLLFNGERLSIDVERPPSGGGDKYEPVSAVEASAALLPQVTEMRERFRELDQSMKVPGQSFVEATLLPNYLAATSFPSQLLDHLGAVPVGSRSAEGTYQTATTSKPAITRKVLLAVPDAALEKLESLLNTNGDSILDRSVRSAFDDVKKINEITLPSNSIELEAFEVPEGEKILWEVVLNPVGLRGDSLIAASQELLNQFSSVVSRFEGDLELNFVREVSGLTFIPVRATKREIEQISKFNLLRTVRPMPALPPRPVFGLRAATNWSPPVSSGTRDTAFKVAVFDGGLDVAGGNGQIKAQAVDLTPEPAIPDALIHGTAVTGASLYGHIKHGEQAEIPPLPVDSFRVLPAPHLPDDLHGYWVLDRILEIVKHDQHKIVNLSLGPTLPVRDDHEPNRWTAELDTLAWERDVLFVIAAGNDGHLDGSNGQNRIQVPADMVNGFAVGACDAIDPEPAWNRSSYSSVGPGRWGSRIQPLGVQFGGSDTNKFPLLASNGTFLEATGTSFSAPLVTHAFSELAINLPVVNTNILRAFGVHFSERPRRRHKILQPEVGYGRIPSDFLRYMTCTPNETHVLFRDDADRNEISAYRLPIPRGINGQLQLRMTLSYLSPVEPAEATEYTKASIDLAFRPHQYMHKYTSPNNARITQTVDRRTPEALALIQAGWKESQEPVTRTLSNGGGSSEVNLRESGKWETVRHYRVTFDADKIELPRIELSYIARAHGRLDKTPSKLPFALVISIVDPSENGVLYDSARSQFQVLQPATRVRSQVGLRSGSPKLWQS